MKFYGKGSKKFYEQKQAIIKTILEKGKIVLTEPDLPGGSRRVFRDKENGVVAKVSNWNEEPDSHVKKFVVPTVIHGDFCFQPLVEVHFDDPNFIHKAEKLLNQTILNWYLNNNLPDIWVENVGIHDGKVKLIDW